MLESPPSLVSLSLSQSSVESVGVDDFNGSNLCWSVRRLVGLMTCVRSFCEQRVQTQHIAPFVARAYRLNITNATRDGASEAYQGAGHQAPSHPKLHQLHLVIFTCAGRDARRCCCLPRPGAADLNSVFVFDSFLRSPRRSCAAPGFLPASV